MALSAPLVLPEPFNQEVIVPRAYLARTEPSRPTLVQSNAPLVTLAPNPVTTKLPAYSAQQEPMAMERIASPVHQAPSPRNPVQHRVPIVGLALVLIESRRLAKSVLRALLTMVRNAYPVLLAASPSQVLPNVRFVWQGLVPTKTNPPVNYVLQAPLAMAIPTAV
jgi:hypothetical protein